MNILYINHYAGSPLYGMEYRPYYLSREWVRAGHSVRILAGGYSHVRSVQPNSNGVSISQRTIEWIDGIEYVWYPIPSYVGNGFGRMRNICSFLGQVAWDSRKIVEEFQPDVVIASSTYPLDIWAARRISRMSGAKWVYEVHDLWPLTPIELGGMSPYNPFIVLCQLAENTAYRDADAVVSMLPTVHNYMQDHGLDLQKLHIIPNGVSLEDWSGELEPISHELANNVLGMRSRGDFVVGYAGFHGLQNDLEPLLDAAEILKDRPVSFVLVGDGHEKKRLQRKVYEKSLKNVMMFPPVPKSQIPRLLESFDCGYMGAPKSPIYRFGVSPNKLLDYMMAGVPILYAVEAGNDLVAESGSGVSVQASNPGAIVAGINKLMEIDPDERREMGKRGRQFVAEKLAYRVLAQKFTDIVT